HVGHADDAGAPARRWRLRVVGGEPLGDIGGLRRGGGVVALAEGGPLLGLLRLARRELRLRRLRHHQGLGSRGELAPRIVGECLREGRRLHRGPAVGLGLATGGIPLTGTLALTGALALTEALALTGTLALAQAWTLALALAWGSTWHGAWTRPHVRQPLG